jgi:SAM-dependent methyltransferase
LNSTAGVSGILDNRYNDLKNNNPFLTRKRKQVDQLVLKGYFKNLYQRTMHEAYGFAQGEIGAALQSGGKCLDCGAHQGHRYEELQQIVELKKSRYFGIEWNESLVKKARSRNLNVLLGDLSDDIQFTENTFACVFGLSVLEHLLKPCKFLKECYRILIDGGKLIILTPNISTYFTAALIILGKMPSSGPHPDSDQLLKQGEIFKVSSETMQPDCETDTPAHRHLIVFSYRALKAYLIMAGFKNVRGYGFGLYPFPNFLQPILERIDPYHCHQMVFVAQK